MTKKSKLKGANAQNQKLNFCVFSMCSLLTTVLLIEKKYKSATFDLGFVPFWPYYLGQFLSDFNK